MAQNFITPRRRFVHHVATDLSTMSRLMTLIGIPMVAVAGAVITWRSKPRGEAGGSAVRAQVQD